MTGGGRPEEQVAGEPGLPQLHAQLDAAVAAPSGHTASPDTAPSVALRWGRAIALLAPAVLCGAAGGALGLATIAGGVCIAISIAYLLVDVIFLHPRLVYFSPALELEQEALSFLQQSLAARDLGEVYEAYRATLRDALGIEEPILLVPIAGTLHAFGGSAADAEAAASAVDALAYLEQAPRAITRDDLAADLHNPSAAVALALLDRLRGDFFVPLFRAGSLLGLAVAPFPSRFASHAERFCEAIGSYLTTALVHGHLRQVAGSQSHLSQAFSLANAVQEALMPDERTVQLPGLRIKGFSRPAAKCGGDVWSWHELGEGKILIFIGDATGHGASSAILAAAVSGAVAAHAMTVGPRLEPDVLLAELNRLVHRAGMSDHMLTAFAAVVDVSRSEVSFAGAGHNLPYLVRGQGGQASVSSLMARGNILGALPDWRSARYKAELEVGDKLVFYTDGILDAGEPFIQHFGPRRLVRALEVNAAESADTLSARVQGLVLEHLGEHELADDVTFVAVEIVARLGTQS